MAIRQWPELNAGQRAGVLALAVAQLGLAISAWRDLARTPASRVRGRKGVWAAVIAVNWIGPLSWFRWGRRR